ncbi:response regulator transcription factor [Algivirga pacifica]|uniref:DNA-binding response regulator n=1 Tax=Algivirga pacifica TaxID=1162670 RepID=A0ABP9DGS2_9BACT
MEEALKIVIVEDDLVIGRSLSFTLEDLGYEVLEIFRKGEDAEAFMKQKPKVDLLLLDIELLGTYDGVQTATALRAYYKGPIIYLTSLKDEETFNRAKHTVPAAYLQKPFDKYTLRSSIELAMYKSKTEEEDQDDSLERLTVSDAIFVKSKNKLVKVVVGNIKYIQANDIYASVVTDEGSYLVNYALKHLEKKLPNTPFIRVHRSYIVNVDQVDGLEDNHLLIGEVTIPIGKTYREELMKYFKVL